LRSLRQHIKHAIYIVKENRTYDQILGDLPAGNGDPNLTQFPQAVTPNQHALAKQFVQLDNFYDPSNVSYEGWQWSTAARSVDATEKTYSVNYAKRGLSYDSEGTDRNINVAYRNVAARRAANPVTPGDPDLLPGPRNEEDIDGPGRGGEHRSSWCNRPPGTPAPMRQSLCTTRRGGRRGPRVLTLPTPIATIPQSIIASCGKARWAANPTPPIAPGSICVTIVRCRWSRPASSSRPLSATGGAKDAEPGRSSVVLQSMSKRR
jgi:hypothetical protein